MRSNNDKYNSTCQIQPTECRRYATIEERALHNTVDNSEFSAEDSFRTSTQNGFVRKLQPLICWLVYTFRVKQLEHALRGCLPFGVLGGKASLAAADIEKILSSVGIESDTEKVKRVLSELNEKSVDELIEQGRSKLASVPAAAAPAAEQKKEEIKKAEKPESESEDEDMGFALFD
ncbi:hypothetical protein WA026_021962 [Henosepilachna vigintioctopunctata]|uniref:Large ribosomal subunit protein P2 n=1 Tax=Henosepilachna vigintioctopunctata TaxID=420089 RepID=A0AAW1VJ64_9CUCU